MSTNRDLPRLLVALMKGLAIVVVVVAVVFFLPTPSDYLAAFADKEKMLEDAPTPRAILIGGSSMAFGVDSSVVSDELRMTAINTGLHAGVGIAFMVEHVRPFVRKGDVVVLVPEYAILSASGVVDDGVVASTLLSAPASLRYIQADDWGPLLRGFPDFALHRTIVDPASALAKSANLRNVYTYTRRGFDARGDEVGHLREPKPRLTFTMTFDPNVAVQIGRLNRFAADMAQRGATTVFLYPAVPRGVIQANRADVEAYDRAVRAAITFPISGTPEEAAVDDGAFFDTAYHLDGEGRAANTARIVRQLQSLLRVTEPPGGGH